MENGRGMQGSSKGAELNGEQLRKTTANRRPEARLDISATGFWIPG